MLFLNKISVFLENTPFFFIILLNSLQYFQRIAKNIAFFSVFHILFCKILIFKYIEAYNSLLSAIY